MNIRDDYKQWSTQYLGKQVGKWYTPYLEQMGSLLKKFKINEDLNSDFFTYASYEEYLPIYVLITEDNEKEVAEILDGKRVHYSESMKIKNKLFLREYQQMELDAGKRKSLNDFGGIASFGAVLRSYLKYLYYVNSDIDYPSAVQLEEGTEADFDINYWVFSTGTNGVNWNLFMEKGIVSLSIEDVEDFSKFNSLKDVRTHLIEAREGGNIPNHDSKAVWDFYNEMKPGDIIYAKMGINTALGRGIVQSDYIYNEDHVGYESSRIVEWTHIGKWELRSNINPKKLTCLTNDTAWTKYMERLITEGIDDDENLVKNQFKVWHETVLQSNGKPYDYKTIDVRLRSISYLEELYKVSIFSSTDIEFLNAFHTKVLEEDLNEKYKGIVGPALKMFIRYIETLPTISSQEAFTIDNFLDEVYIDRKQYDVISSVLLNKKNIIFKGAPGVGKTYIAARLAYSIMEEKDEDRIKLIQFHQSYSYEDFIEGLRPNEEGDGFSIHKGPFVKFARKAERDPEHEYFFIIDEINRGNMSKIFGELLMLIENDKRGESINLLYSGENFSVPENLYIIGMMNTADRSLALIDYALRRRFSFIDLQPAFDNHTFNRDVNKVNENEKIHRVISVVKALNQEIKTHLGTGFMIGHSYFATHQFESNVTDRLSEIIEFDIIPQLEEYWFDEETLLAKWISELRNALQ